MPAPGTGHLSLHGCAGSKPLAQGLLIRSFLFSALVCVHSAQLQQGQQFCSQDVPGIPLNWRAAGKVLALTFDDGPQAAGINAVLNVLKANNVLATFFVNTYRNSDWLGSFDSPANQAALKWLLAEDHELGSHAAEHLRLSQLPTADAERQILWGIGNISRVTGNAAVPLFRAPYGDGFIGVSSPTPPATRQLWDIVKRHHVHIAWSFSGEDYRIGGSDTGCAERLFNAYGPPLVQANTSGIVLMHSTTNAMGGCPQALQRLITYYKAAGYRFVKVSKLIEQRYGAPAWQVVQRSCAAQQLRRQANG